MCPSRSLRRVLAYVWASPWSLVGLLLAPLFSRRRVESGVLVCEGASWPGRLGWRYTAITFGHVVLCVTATTESLMRHELAHVRQYERWGPLFLPAYLLGSLWAVLTGKHYYRDNPFESALRRGDEPPPSP